MVSDDGPVVKMKSVKTILIVLKSMTTTEVLTENINQKAPIRCTFIAKNGALILFVKKSGSHRSTKDLSIPEIFRCIFIEEMDDFSD